MAATTSLLAAGMLTQGLGAYSAANTQATAAQLQGDFQRSQFETNARFAELQAQDVREIGDKQAAAHKRAVKDLRGKQRAAGAGQGLDLDESGGFINVHNDAGAAGAVDEVTIRANAWRDSWGLRTQAQDYRSRGAFAHLSGNAVARNTLLTGSLQGVGYGLQSGYYAYGGK